MPCCAKLLQSYPTLCHPIDCHPPRSSIHGILQARIPPWVASSSSMGSCRPRDQTHVSCGSCNAGRFFTTKLYAPQKNTNKVYQYPSFAAHARLWGRQGQLKKLWQQRADLKKAQGNLPGGPVAKTPSSQCRGPGSIPGQGTRSHMPKQRARMPNK